MKKIATKVVSLVMALALCIGMGATALAAEATIEYPSPSDTGSIIIHDLASRVTANAYQIAEAEYDDNGNMLGYVMTVEDTTFKINYDGSYNKSALTEQNLAEIWSALGNDPTATSSATANSAGTATIEKLPIGTYLVVISGSESVVYGMMIGSVYYSNSNGNWTIVSGEITDVKDCELWAKSTTPTVTKTEHHDGKSESHGETTNAGDEITFDIRVANIPSYLGDNPEFHVDDKLTGLTISENELASLTVRIMESSSSNTTIATLEKDKDYTITPVGNEAPYTEFDVDFVVNGKYTLNDYSGYGYAILIEYQAIVVDTGDYSNNTLEHDNDVVLTYATTSYLAGNDGTDEDHDYEYDFDAELVKEDASDSTPLSGAVFALYTDYACTTPYMRDGKSVTATSGTDGKFAFTGLNTGTYYFKEIEAPAGYALNETVYAVTISATVSSSTGETSKVEVIYWIPTADSPTYSTYVTPIEPVIYNTPLGTLPSMGSTGITLCVIAGCAVIAATVCGVVIYRKHSNA